MEQLASCILSFLRLQRKAKVKMTTMATHVTCTFPLECSSEISKVLPGRTEEIQLLPFFGFMFAHQRRKARNRAKRNEAKQTKLNDERFLELRNWFLSTHHLSQAEHCTTHKKKKESTKQWKRARTQIDQPKNARGARWKTAVWDAAKRVGACCKVKKQTICVSVPHACTRHSLRYFARNNDVNAMYELGVRFITGTHDTCAHAGKARDWLETVCACGILHVFRLLLQFDLILLLFSTCLLSLSPPLLLFYLWLPLLKLFLLSGN